jgi:hypothetical protein
MPLEDLHRPEPLQPTCPLTQSHFFKAKLIVIFDV